jgi:hypothetical protein
MPIEFREFTFPYYFNMHYPGNMCVTFSLSPRPRNVNAAQGMSRPFGGKCSDTFAGDLQRRQVSIDIIHRSILSGYPNASYPSPIMAVLRPGLFRRQHYDSLCHEDWAPPLVHDPWTIGTHHLLQLLQDRLKCCESVV